MRALRPRFEIGSRVRILYAASAFWGTTGYVQSIAWCRRSVTWCYQICLEGGAVSYLYKEHELASEIRTAPTAAAEAHYETLI